MKAVKHFVQFLKWIMVFYLSIGIAIFLSFVAGSYDELHGESFFLFNKFTINEVLYSFNPEAIIIGLIYVTMALNPAILIVLIFSLLNFRSRGKPVKQQIGSYINIAATIFLLLQIPLVISMLNSHHQYFGVDLLILFKINVIYTIIFCFTYFFLWFYIFKPFLKWKVFAEKRVTMYDL